MYEKELRLAMQAVKIAEKTFKQYYGTQTQVKIKDNNYRNLVSIADKKIERQIKTFLQKKFPDYGFIGEEYGNKNIKNDFVWALDPIDGTTNYLHGLPDCAISLGLLHKNKTVVGVILAPYVNRFYTAQKGKGAFLNGKKIKVSDVKNVKMAFGSMGWGRNIEHALFYLPRIIPHILKFRVPGSAALGLAYVAQGSYDFFLDKSMKIWDWAAGRAILEEAGGIFTMSPKGTYVCSNKKIALPLMNFIKKTEKIALPKIG
jgi:myo-inositol-1(or 4)-monophosphatase